MIDHLLDHRARILRRVEERGDRLETEVSYYVPSGMDDVPVFVTRRRTILADKGTGLQPVGQRTVFVGDVSLVFEDRDIVQVVEGPAGFQGPENLEVVSRAKPRGHHTELLVEDYAGAIREAGS